MDEEFLPPALANKPECWDENEEYMAAFFDLSPSRAVGMSGAGAIPVSEMQAYCQLFEVDDPQQFYRRVRASDMAFLNWQAEKSKNGA